MLHQLHIAISSAATDKCCVGQTYWLCIHIRSPILTLQRLIFPCLVGSLQHQEPCANQTVHGLLHVISVVYANNCLCHIRQCIHQNASCKAPSPAQPTC